jgi:hypothetical protein
LVALEGEKNDGLGGEGGLKMGETVSKSAKIVSKSAKSAFGGILGLCYLIFFSYLCNQN